MDGLRGLASSLCLLSLILHHIHPVGVPTLHPYHPSNLQSQENMRQGHSLTLWQARVKFGLEYQTGRWGRRLDLWESQSQWGR